jgi:hypothetical protein
MLIYLSALVCLIGLLLFALATDGKITAIGFACFQCGLLAFLITVPHLLRLP